MRILHVDNEPSVLHLMFRDFVVEHTYETEDAIELAKLYEYDAIIVEPVMRGGSSIVRALRIAKVKSAIIVLSLVGGVAATVDQLNNGADDYLTKPFEGAELRARIHAVVRRYKGHAVCAIQVGRIVVNIDSKVVEVDGQRVHLTGKEYAMLELLAYRKGRTLTKETFMNHLYQGRDEPELKIIDVFVCKLRRKLGSAADHLQTVWGRGYLFDVPPTLPQQSRPRIFPLPIIDSPPLQANEISEMAVI